MLLNYGTRSIMVYSLGTQMFHWYPGFPSLVSSGGCLLKGGGRARRPGMLLLSGCPPEEAEQGAEMPTEHLCIERTNHYEPLSWQFVPMPARYIEALVL